MNRILEQPVCLPHKTNRCEITFYPAGHMAGAVMTCVRTQESTAFFIPEILAGKQDPDKWNKTSPDS